MSSFVDFTEKQELPKFQALPNLFKHILGANNPQRHTFLVDLLRCMKVRDHWDPVEKKTFLCDKINFKDEKYPCERCALAKADANKKDKDKYSTSMKRLAPTYCHDKVGKKRPDKNGKPTDYDDNPVGFLEVRAGEAESTFNALLEANGDPFEYYERDSDDNLVLDKSSLLNNRMMYTEGGSDQVYSFTKSVVGAKTSYPVPTVVQNIKNVKDIHGNQVKINKIPKEVREEWDNKSIEEVFALAIEGYPNPNWDELSKYGIKKPPKREPAGLASATETEVSGQNKL